MTNTVEGYPKAIRAKKAIKGLEITILFRRMDLRLR
jgi:hypothetical protein